MVTSSDGMAGLQSCSSLGMRQYLKLFCSLFILQLEHTLWYVYANEISEVVTPKINELNKTKHLAHITVLAFLLATYIISKGESLFFSWLLGDSVKKKIPNL